MKKLVAAFLFTLPCVVSFAQYRSQLSKQEWVDSVFKSLSNDEKIAQLMVVRAHSNLGPEHVAKVTNDISRYNVGALCFFQGGPVRQANLTNYYQGNARTPLMVTIDGEWGLGMRLDSVLDFPYQLTLGAMDDDDLVYRMGVAIGEQCKRLGVHVNYAPVVDINNNPGNPVIGYRSFGEDKEKVARFGVAYMKGMQDAGIMACAKHFPGHGDVDVDSHYDLPVINKNRSQLDSMELMPFRAIFKAGVGSVMIAHLYIPAIDNTTNRATSISKNNVTNLLREDMGYDGLTFTDALEMKGVAKYFPGGTIAVEAIIAGNDMLCLPASVPESIEAIKKAIKKKKLKWKDIDAKVLKVLNAKYDLGLNEWNPISLNNLTDELNASTNRIRREVAEKSITLLRQRTVTFPLNKNAKVAYVGIGTNNTNEFGKRMIEDWGADTYLMSYKDGSTRADEITARISKGGYDAVIIGVHDYSLRPANNYGLSPVAVKLVKDLPSFNSATILFGNVLAVSNFCDAGTIVGAHQDDDITRHAVADLINGTILSRGTLPVSVCQFKFGDGIVHAGIKPEKASIDEERFRVIDSIANDAIAKKAFPGCVVMAVHDGKIVYHKAFGKYEYDPSAPPMTEESIFDLASVTKVSATTLAVMKLYDEGKLNLKKTLGDYLPMVRGTDKAGLVVEDVLLHQAGLVPFIPFYKETIDSTGAPDPAIYSTKRKAGFNTRVAEGLFIRDDWNDTIFNRILKSPLGPRGKYVYSDNDFIFLGKIVEALSGLTLDQYVQKNFYSRMGLSTMGFTPRKRFSPELIVPTEEEKHFRRQLMRGDVHDEGASLFGGVAGHAGLFSNSYDLAMLYQMLLNGGELNGRRYLSEETINYFTDYHSSISRRGLGFDKPEKDNDNRDEPYPSALASPATFGHTGFTGTCVWVDPRAKLVYVFLSNRVYPTRNNPLLSRLNVRPKIQDALYSVLGLGDGENTYLGSN